MSISSKSPRSSRHNSFSNLFGLGKSSEIENVPMERVDNHEGTPLYEIEMPSTSREVQRIDGDLSDGNYEDEYDEHAKSTTYTQNHPMGRILLDMATEEGKSKKSSRKIDVDRLCQNFYEAMQMEARNRDRQFKTLVKQVEDNLLKKELTSHTVSMDIRPPTHFAQKPILGSVAQKNECIKLYPTRNKFGNTSKDSNMDVVEFLYAMNSAHESCKISKEEFKEMLLACTTGKPHSLIRGWISSGYDIDTIYHYLQVHFDTRLSAQEASNQLKVYKAPKHSNLAKVQAHLMELATRACSQIPEGPSRTALFDLELNQALIRSLPIESQQMVQTKFNELSARQGRAATAAELSQVLHSIRHIIDQDIKKNGGERQEKYNGIRNGRIFRTGATPKGDPKRYKTTSALSIDTPHFKGYRPALGINLPITRRYQEEDFDKISLDSYNEPEHENNYYHRRIFTTPRPYARTYQVSSLMKQENAPMLRARNYENNRITGNRQAGMNSKMGKMSPKPSMNRSRPPHRNSNLGTNYCSLCGRRNHLASHGCPNMVDDNGKIINVLPTHSTCTDCPARITPRLNHPTQLCPYRKAGPFKNLA